MKENLDFKALESFRSIDYSDVSSFPVYQDTVELLRIILIVNQQVSKTYQILVENIVKSLITILKGIINAQRCKETRQKTLEKCLDHVLHISTLVSLLILFTKIGQSNSSRIDILLDQIGKQLNGWKSKQVV